MSVRFKELLTQIRNCRECESILPNEPRPILAASPKAKLLIVGQAPGIRAHESRQPWNDPSGVRLREWLGISEAEFYDPQQVALVPMGFCYPGTGEHGDLPPPKICSELWHHKLEAGLTKVELTLLIGNYALKDRLGDRCEGTLTETVRNWRNFTPDILPLPHPSPRNNRWLKKNPWFEDEVLPYLRRRMAKLRRK